MTEEVEVDPAGASPDAAAQLVTVEAPGRLKVAHWDGQMKWAEREARSWRLLERELDAASNEANFLSSPVSLLVGNHATVALQMGDRFFLECVISMVPSSLA